MATLAPLGPSPFDADHHVLVQRLSSIHDQIGALTAESVLVQSEIEALVTKKVDWEREERARLQREEEERLERERREREERERLERERVERERVERVERERKEKEERERIERERAEREEKERLERLERERVEQERLARVEAERMAALETEKAARQAEKERLEREWAEKERLEEEAREEAERKEEEKRQREAALAAASAGAIAAQSTSAESGPRELNLRCQALYDLDGDENNDELSFSTGDLFTVSGEMNGWMSARQERTGKVGLVPSNYLKVLEVLEPQAQPQAAGVQSAGSGVHSNGVGGTAAVPAAAVASAEKEKKGESVVALFDFVGENDDELSFTTGQRLLKTGEVNGWYIGTLEGQTKVGIFPSNFVELVEDVGVAADSAVPVNEEPAPVSTPVAITATTYASADPSNDRHRVLPSGLASSGASATMTPAPSVQRTKSTAFAAAEVASLAQMANDTAAPATPRSSMGASTPSSSAAGNSAPVDGVEPDAVALFKFTATSHDQLSFDKGAKLAIKATLNGWYVGQEIGKPALGIFPANYVQKREKDDKGAALGNGGSQAGLAKSEEARKEQAAVAVAGAGAGALVADDGAEPSWRYNKAKVAESPAFSSAGTPLTPSSPSNAPKVIGHVTALYDYHSTTPENLSFSKGDVIPVVKEIKGWWAGLLDGKLGLVPSNYCTPFRPVDGAGNDSAAPVATVGMAGAALMSSQAAHAPVSSFAASSASTNGTAGAKYPVVSSGGLPAHVQPFAVLAPTTSSSSVSVAPSAVSVASSQPQKASEVSAPPPLSAKPQLLSSLAMSNAGSGQPNNAGAYPVVGTANSAANASLTPVVAPVSTGPSRAQRFHHCTALHAALRGFCTRRSQAGGAGTRGGCAFCGAVHCRLPRPVRRHPLCPQRLRPRASLSLRPPLLCRRASGCAWPCTTGTRASAASCASGRTSAWSSLRRRRAGTRATCRVIPAGRASSPAWPCRSCRPSSWRPPVPRPHLLPPPPSLRPSPSPPRRRRACPDQRRPCPRRAPSLAALRRRAPRPRPLPTCSLCRPSWPSWSAAWPLLSWTAAAVARSRCGCTWSASG